MKSTTPRETNKSHAPGFLMLYWRFKAASGIPLHPNLVRPANSSGLRRDTTRCLGSLPLTLNVVLRHRLLCYTPSTLSINKKVAILGQISFWAAGYGTKMKKIL
jgi:hypothetical protein